MAFVTFPPDSVSDGELGFQITPRVTGELTHPQGDLVFLLIDPEDLDLDLLSDLKNIRRVIDS